MGTLSSHIFSPSEIVDYASMIKSHYEKPNPAIMVTPFVGFKILMTDEDAIKGTGETRMRYLEQHIGKVLEDTGCFLRETNNQLMPNGFWLVSMPVPVTQLRSPNADQIGRIIRAVNDLASVFNICFAGRTEVNVSGRCTVPDTESALSNILISTDDTEYLMRPKHSAYSVGNVIRINDLYMLLRTSWDLSRFVGYPDSLGEKMLQLAYNISPIFR